MDRLTALKIKVRLLELLVLKGDHPEPGVGLCWHIADAYGSVQTTQVADWRRKCFREWPEYSGDHVYPVPAVGRDSSGYRAFSGATNYYAGKYGEARLRLAQFMLDDLNKQFPN